MYESNVPHMYLLPFKMADNRFATEAGDDVESLLEEVDVSINKKCTATASCKYIPGVFVSQIISWF